MRFRLPVSPDFLVTRLLAGLVSIWGAVSLVFIMLLVTGNPALTLAGDDASVELIGRIAEQHGFDLPWWQQYGIFLRNLATGNFPASLWTNEPAFTVVLTRVPRTIILAGLGLAVGALIGLLVGYISATSRHRWLRDLSLGVLLVLNSIPSFVLALALIMLFSLQLRWLPTSGATSLRHYIMPVLTLGLLIAPDIARVFRSAIVELGQEDHVKTALAKGISERQVRIRHVAMNALVPVISLIGMRLGGILGGAVVVETVFAWPGIGQLLLESVLVRDYPVALAAVVLIAIGYVVATIATDIVVKALTPRGVS